MKTEELIALKGKLVSAESPYRSRPFLGLIYHVDGDMCHLIDGTQNRAWVNHQQTTIREATGEEAIAQILSDCKCGISDMNLEGNFISGSDE